MTYAPDDLKAVQRYVHELTGQDYGSLGIVGDTSHNSSGGYHVGHDVLHVLERAPEDPGSDYSYRESPRDRSGLTDAASAFDLGGEFDRFREVTLALVAAAERGDPRMRDVREIIYSPDGVTVCRFDACRVRTYGDSSHLYHTHFSFFRDSEGRRADVDNFLGLLREVFEGKRPLTKEEDDMAVGQLPVGFAYDENGNLIDRTKTVQVPMEDVNVVLGNVILSFSSDHLPAGMEWHVRAASGTNTGSPFVYQNGKAVIKAGQQRVWMDVTDGHTWLCFGRRKTSATDTDDAQPIGWSVARYPK